MRSHLNKILYTFFLFAFLIQIESIHAQSASPTDAEVSTAINSNSWKGKNTIFVELLGIAESYSVNYSRYFYHKNEVKLFLRAGLGYLPTTYSKVINLPVGIGMLLGNSKSHFEIGYSVMPMYVDVTPSTIQSYVYYYGTRNLSHFNIKHALNFGYKYIPKKLVGFTFGVNMYLFLPSLRLLQNETYIYGFATNSNALVSPYVSVQLGYMF